MEIVLHALGQAIEYIRYRVISIKGDFICNNVVNIAE